MTITKTPNSIYLTGSWATLYFGNNVQILTRSQAKLVLEQLSDELQLPLWKATITQLEFAANLAMSEPVGLYLPLLQSYKDYKRNSTDVESVRFWARTKRTNRAHELSFYNKQIQCTDENIIIPPEFENKHLLRYELKLNSKIPKQLGIDNITAEMLCEQQIFDMIGRKWQSDYFEVVKAQSKVSSLRPKNIRTPTAGVEAMAAMYAARHNAEYRADFQFLKDNDVFLDPKYYSRLKAKLEKNNYVDFRESGDLIDELDQKILEAFETYRQ